MPSTGKCNMTCVISPDVAKKYNRYSSDPEAYRPWEFYIDYPAGTTYPSATVTVKFDSAGHLVVGSHAIKVECTPANPFTSKYFPNTDSVSVTVSGPTRLKFIDFNDNYMYVYVFYNAKQPIVGITDIPLAATFNPASGATVPQTVSITTPLGSGAKVYYTIDGSVPSRSSTLYTGPISLTSACRLRTFQAPVDPAAIVGGNTRYVQSYSEAIYSAAATTSGQMWVKFKQSANNIEPVNGDTVFQKDSTIVTLTATPSAVPHKIYYSLGENNYPSMRSPVFTPGCIKLTATETVRAFVVPDVEVFNGVKYDKSPVLSTRYVKSSASGQGCLPPQVETLFMTFDDTITPDIQLLTAGAKVYYTTDGTKPTTLSPSLGVGDSPPTIIQDTMLRMVTKKQGLPSSEEIVMVLKKRMSDAISQTPTLDQSNIVVSTLGLRFVVMRYAGGYTCKMFVPRFPRTIVDGVVAGDFDHIGIVSTITTTSTMILLVEEPYGSLLCTIYLSDNTIKRYRSYSNGKTWDDVTNEVVL